MRTLPAVVAGGVIAFLAASPGAVARRQSATTGSPGPRASGKALILGRVLEVDTHAPVSGAALWVRSYTGVSAVDIVRTNVDGEFVIPNLPPGRWFISASKAGFQQTTTAGQEIVVEDGERIADLTLLVTRDAAIGGTVTDERGDPLVGVRVTLLGRGPSLQWRSGETATTDDRGAYRFPALQPGDYLVAVPSTIATVPVAQLDRLEALTAGGDRAAAEWRSGVPRGMQRGTPSTIEIGHLAAAIDRTPAPPRLDDAGRRLAYATAFYPGVPDLRTAQPLTLSSGQERSGVDLQLLPVRTVRVAGSLASPTGHAERLAVSLGTADVRDLPTFLTASTVTDEDGRFELPCVPAGDYQLRVLKLPSTSPPQGPSVSPTAAETLWASMPLSVGDADLTDLVVPLNTGVHVSGAVRFEGSSPLPPADRILRASVLMAAEDKSLAGSGGTIVAAHVQADGRFATIGLPAGKYGFNVSLLEPWRLKSAMWQGRDIADTALELSDRDVTGVAVTYTDRVPRVTGTVRDDRGGPVVGATVVAFPADRGMWKENRPPARRVKQGHSLPTGRYALVDLPIGDYFVAAFPRDPPPDWTRADALARLARFATRVVVGENGGTQDLQVLTDRSEPAEAAHAEPEGSGLIVGTLLADEIPARPLRSATITLNSTDGSVARTTFTDDAGRFAFDRLPAGSFRLTASKPGYLAIDCGATQPGRPGESIPLAAGQRVTLSLQIPHGAALSGRVTDQRGDPVSAAVHVLVRHAVTGALLEVPAAQPAQPRTDERGIYRVYGLPAGEYYVGVTYGMVGAGTAGHETTAADLQRAREQVDGAPTLVRPGTTAPEPASSVGAHRSVYSPAFYPGAVTLEDAAPVVLGRGEERAGVDILVPLVPGVTLAGSVMAPDGSVPEALTVALSPDRPYIPAGQIDFSTSDGSVRSKGGLVIPPVTANGRFAILSLTPGRYNVVAQGTVRADIGASSSAAPRMWARTTVTIADRDITDLVVTLQPGLTAHGHVVVDPEDAVPPTGRLRLALTAARDGDMSISPAPASGAAPAHATGGTPGAALARQGGGRPQCVARVPHDDARN